MHHLFLCQFFNLSWILYFDARFIINKNWAIPCHIIKFNNLLIQSYKSEFHHVRGCLTFLYHNIIHCWYSERRVNSVDNKDKRSLKSGISQSIYSSVKESNLLFTL